MSFNLTMNRAWDLLDKTLRQKQENFQTQLRSNETMERLRADTELGKQRMMNEGGVDIANIRAQGGIQQQAVANQGVLGQQQLRNQGELQGLTLRNQGALDLQSLKNQGDLGVEGLRQTGATERSQLTEGGVNRRFDLSHLLDHMKQKDNVDLETSRQRIDLFGKLNDSGGLVNRTEDNFFDNVDKYRYLGADQAQKKRLADRMRALGY